MTLRPDIAVLRAGDVLTYSANDIWGRLIEWKTGAPTRSHVEVYCGGAVAFGARSSGVGYFPVRIDKYLMEVRRHGQHERFNLVSAREAVSGLVGKPYEFTGLLALLWPWKKTRHLIRVCSTTATRFLRAGGLEPFDAAVPDNSISPDDFVVTGKLDTIWADEHRIMISDSK